MSYIINNDEKIITVTVETPTETIEYILHCPNGLEGIISEEKSMLAMNEMFLEKFGSNDVLEKENEMIRNILSVIN